MKPDEFFLPYAESAFNAYGVKAKWKTYDGKRMPSWSEVGAEVQERWIAAVKDIFHQLKVRDDESGELYVP